MGTVTLLFIDIEGSTRLLQQLGERYAEMLAECRQLLRAVFHRWHGHEVDTQGDAFFVAFARASDAVSAAVEMQRTLATHAWPNGVTVRMRIGLHTGEPQLSSEGYVGLDVHRAARIMSAGHGGQVLLSQTTRDLVEHDLPTEVSLRDLGVHRLKDLASPSHLYQLVLAGLENDFPPLRTLDSSAHNLPIQPTPFIGREKEVDAIQQHLLRQEVRLLTLTGPGGVGKTRLGLQVAAEASDKFTDGTWFVSLAPLSDPELVIPTIAETLAVPEVADRSQLEHLKAWLRERQILLLLDNFEHVVSAAMQVADLLGACPQLKMLVTSREVLHVRAEHAFPVPALVLPDPEHLPDSVTLWQYEAVALFIERAQAVKPDFQVTNTNAPAVAEICARLEGLPLAIELAAARTRMLPPQALLKRLGQRLQLLTSSLRDAPARQHTLRKTIQWSYDLLLPEEQQLFRRLSVFAGGCELSAVEAICHALGVQAAAVLDEVTSLVDKNLLRQTAEEEEEPRFTMLETIREFGLEALAASREMEATRQAHTLYYLALAEEAAPELTGPRSAVWLQRLEREHDNLRAALAWSLEPAQTEFNPEMALRFGATLKEFWEVRGHNSEGRAFLEQALVLCKGASTSARASALGVAAIFAYWLSDFHRQEELYQESLGLYRELGDTRGIASSLRGLAVAAQGTNIAPAIVLREESVTLMRELGDKEALAWSLQNLADYLGIHGEYERAQALFEESLALFRDLGNKRGMAACLTTSAMWLPSARGDQAIVDARLEEMLALHTELGDKEGLAFYFWISGSEALSRGDAATAQAQMEQCLALWQELGARWYMFWPLAFLGRIKAYQGDLGAALTFHEQSLAVAREFHEDWLYAYCLEGLASVVATLGKCAWAARFWGTAESLRERCGIPLAPVERVDYEPAVAAARTHLGEQAFAAAWAEGRTMSFEQAVVAARQVAVSSPTTAGHAASPGKKLSLSYPAGLTTREVEVLRLVAQGMTNEQVAEQIVVSPRTVSTHLTSIYNKLGVTSRSAATRFAVEHQLI
jgi:predicted ATPase/class 3 adenylate cyclase/DNA-binding CsgD family transcriptional regulator